MEKPNTCCYSHSGQLKARYESRVVAEKVRREAEKRRGVKLEIYECELHPGWHLRKAKS